jgi:hypothetical protein
MALKQLDEIAELSETYAYWHKDYKARLAALVTEINNRFATHPSLVEVAVKATDSGELEIRPHRLYLNYTGKLADEMITLAPEAILAIAEVLKGDLL